MTSETPPTVKESLTVAAANHDKAWEKNFIAPIAKAMKQRGVAYMVVIIHDGKATYILEPEPPAAS